MCLWGRLLAGLYDGCPPYIRGLFIRFLWKIFTPSELGIYRQIALIFAHLSNTTTQILKRNQTDYNCSELYSAGNYNGCCLQPAVNAKLPLSSKPFIFCHFVLTYI